MGRLRRDGVSVEHLAGASAQPPIVRPVELTSVPDKWEMRSFEDVAAAMQRAVHVCNLLANQRDVLKNTYLLRVTLLTHFFTRVLPMPMPNSDVRAAVHCFWQGDARPMRYETQSHILKQVSFDVLRLLRGTLANTLKTECCVLYSRVHCVYHCTSFVSQQYVIAHFLQSSVCYDACHIGTVLLLL
jgi:hypothetical protein